MGMIFCLEEVCENKIDNCLDLRFSFTELAMLWMFLFVLGIFQESATRRSDIQKIIVSDVHSGDYVRGDAKSISLEGDGKSETKALVQPKPSLFNQNISVNLCSDSSKCKKFQVPKTLEEKLNKRNFE